MISEATTYKLATSCAAYVYRAWARRSRVTVSSNSSLDGLLVGRFPSLFARTRARHQLESLAEQVHSQLEPLFQTEFGGVPDNELDAAASAVADVLQRSDLSAASFLELNIDPALLEAELAKDSTYVNELAFLAPAAEMFAGRLLRDVCGYVADIVLSLPDFNAEAARAILTRQDELTELVRQVLAQMPTLSGTVDAQGSDAEFLERYRLHISRSLDWLQLFGVELAAAQTRYALSVAYITLSAERIEGGQAHATSNKEVLEHMEGETPWDEQQGDAYSGVRIDEALSDETRIFLRGEAGGGKTTLLQWLAVRAAKEAFEGPMATWNGSVPFLVQLRKFREGSLPNPGQFVSASAPNLQDRVPPGWEGRVLESGHALILVDGLDEVPSTRRQEVRQWLTQLHDDFPSVRVILTSRPAAVREDWLRSLGYSVFRLEPMTTSDIEAFVAHWHKAALRGVEDPDERARIEGDRQLLTTRILDEPPLRHLAVTPLLCALLCSLNKSMRGFIPRDRIDLYRVAIEMLLERRDIERRVDTTGGFSLSLREKQALLQDVAWYFQISGISEAPADAIVDRIARQIRLMSGLSAEPERILEHLLNRSGVIREPVAGRIDFVHKTFQEYLAAQEALEGNWLDAVLQHSSDDAWREVVIMLSGLAPMAVREDLLTRLVRRGDDNRRIEHSQYLLAASCLNTSPRLSEETRELVVSRLERLVPPRNLTDARKLGGAGDVAVPFLVNTGARTAKQAAACIRALSHIATPAALEAIKTYAEIPLLTVTRELIRAWHAFPRRTYADEVLSLSTLERGAITLRDPEALALVASLPNVERVAYRMPFWDQDLESVLSEQRMVDLQIPDAGWVRHLSALGELPLLSRLALGGYFGEDLSGLQEVARLSHFALAYGHNLRSLAGLEYARLTSLDIGHALELNDISALRFDDLETLRLAHTSIFQLDGLSEARNLRTLSLSHSPIRDLSPLSNLSSLRRLSVDSVLDENVDFLSQLEQLQSLDIRLPSTFVGGLSPELRRLTISQLGPLPDAVREARSLTDLRIMRCTLDDLSWLRDFNELRTLWLVDCPELVDLSPLSQLRSLSSLTIAELPLADMRTLGGLAGVKIEHYGFDAHNRTVPYLQELRPRNQVRLY